MATSSVGWSSGPITSSPIIKEVLTVLLDALGAFEDMPSWDEAADGLFNAGLTLNPSALHGAMAGLLGAGFSPHTGTALLGDGGGARESPCH